MNETFDIFLRNVDVRGIDECWPWKLTKDGAGYGMTFLRVGDKKVHTRTHRASYSLFHNVVLDKKTVVRHKCHNPECVNPNHLQTGTQADNMRDMVEAGRSLYGKRHRAFTQPETTARGEKHYAARVDTIKVQVIRYLHSQTGKGACAIGKIFSIPGSTIQHILNRDSWKDVPDIA